MRNNSPILSLLVFCVVLSNYCYSQPSEYSQKETAAAVVSNQFEGRITLEELKAAEGLKLKPEQGQIKSFTFFTAYENKTFSYNVKGSDFNSEIIELINSGKLKSIGISNVKGIVNGNKIILNPIILEIGSPSSKKLAFPFCASFFVGNEDVSRFEVDRNNPKIIRKLRGYYKGELLPIHSCTFTFYKKGEKISKKLSGPSTLANIENEISKRINGESVFLSNIIYSKDNKFIKGTPVLLHVIQ